MDFHCIEDCAECCIQREYYPSKKFGKVGVLILPEEKEIIESHAKKLQFCHALEYLMKNLTNQQKYWHIR
jgi:hypothetical protein